MLVLGAGFAGWHYRESLVPFLQAIISPPEAKSGRPPQRPASVGLAVVQQRPVNYYLNGIGTVTAFKTVAIRSRVEGELIRVAFTEGQQVNEGDLLAEIDPRTWQAQLDQATAQLARNEATLKSSRQTLARLKSLVDAKIVARQEMDDQTSLVDQAAASVNADLAAIANAKLQLEYCKIHSPISGRIGLRLVDPGNIVRAGDAAGLAVVTQLQPISVLFTIPQDDIPRVKRRMQQESDLAVDAFDRNFRVRLATGKLAAIDNQVDSATGTIRLKAVFDNAEELLYPNQFVNARLLVETDPQAIVVPVSAVQRGPASQFVYVLDANGETVSVRDVVSTLTDGGDAIIASGLSPGETVVVEGLDRLQPGAKVTTREQAAKAGREGGKDGAKGEPGKGEPANSGGTGQPQGGAGGERGRS